MALRFAGLSQAQAAGFLTRKLGGRTRPVSATYIGQMALGERPGRPEQWRRIADVTKVPESYIVDGSGWVPPPRATATSAAPDRCVSLTIDPELVSMIRSQGQAAYRLSSTTARAIAKLIEADTGQARINTRDPMVVLILDG